MNRPGFLIPMLALAALFFGWRTYDAWTAPAAPAPSAASAPAASPAGIAPEDAQPAADLSAPVLSIGARPLFRPDRTPYRAEAVSVLPRRNYAAEVARFTLLGVLLRGEDKKGVVVGKGETGRDERWEVGPGDTLPGFTVKEVETEGLTLTADDKEFLLPLYAGGPKGATGKGPARTDAGPARQGAPSPQPLPPAQAGSGAASPGIGRPSPPPVAAPAPPPPRPDDGRGRFYRPSYFPGRR